MRPFLASVVLAALFAGDATAVSSGVISVMATRGPIVPVCSAQASCDGPAAGVRLVVRQRGVAVAHAITDRRGRARLAVSPGRYSVTASYSGSLKPRIESASVLVAAGRTSLLRFVFDTGIR